MSVDMSQQYSPKYRILTEELRQRIRRGEYGPGETLPSQRALVSEYQVSLSTVRQSLGELTREGMVRAEPGRGFFVQETDGRMETRRGLRNGKIGFVCWTASGQDPAYMMMVNGSSEQAQTRGQTISYICVNPDDSSGVETCLELASDLEGMIVCGMVSLDHLQPERFGNTRVVILGDLPDDSECEPFSWVSANGHAAGHLAVQMLLLAGHRRLGLVTRQGRTDYYRRVEKGFRDACHEADLPAPGIYGGKSSPHPDDERRIADEIIESGSVTGLVVIDDARADRLLGYLQGSLQIPDDLSVVGIGGLSGSSLVAPRLSRIDLGYRQMGAEAARLLLEGNSGIVHKSMPVYVDAGETVAPPRNGARS